MPDQIEHTPEMSEENYRCFIFYYNPQDERLWVPKRSGIGHTFNFARPESYVIMAIPFALGAAISLGVFLFAR